MTDKPVTPTTFTEVRKARGRLARSTGLYGPNHPATVAARQEFRCERWLAAVRAVVDEAPPLNEDQKARLATLLAPVAAGGAA